MPLWIFIQIRKITVSNISKINLGHLSSIAIRKKLLIDSIAADAVYIFCRILFQFFFLPWKYPMQLFFCKGILSIVHFTGAAHAPRVIHARWQTNITIGKRESRNKREKKTSFFFYELNL